MEERRQEWLAIESALALTQLDLEMIPPVKRRVRLRRRAVSSA
jgi:hypothetical protein